MAVLWIDEAAVVGTVRAVHDVLVEATVFGVDVAVRGSEAGVGSGVWHSVTFVMVERSWDPCSVTPNTGMVILLLPSISCSNPPLGVEGSSIKPNKSTGINRSGFRGVNAGATGDTRKILPVSCIDDTTGLL